METTPKRGRGRPVGRDYTVLKNIRFTPEQALTLKALAGKLGVSDAEAVRLAVGEKATREGLAPTSAPDTG